jgi:hypothetical protein
MTIDSFWLSLNIRAGPDNVNLPAPAGKAKGQSKKAKGSLRPLLIKSWLPRSFTFDLLCLP